MDQSIEPCVEEAMGLATAYKSTSLDELMTAWKWNNLSIIMFR